MVLEQFIIDADIIWDQVGKTFFENPEAKPGRIMRVQVVNAGIIEDLTGYTLNLGWTSVRDPSKFGLDAFDDVDITKGIFEIEYTSGMLTNIGPLNASLQLVPPGEGRPIESNNFKLTVKNSAINPAAIQGETSFSTLENALVEVNGWNARIDVVEQEFKDRADALDGAYPVRLTAAEQSVAAVEAQVDLLNRGLGETMPTMASLLSTYPTGDTRDHIVAGNIAEVDTLTVTGVPTTAGNVTVTLNGVAVNVPVTIGVAEVASLLVTAVPTVAGNVTVNLNGTAVTIAVDPVVETTMDLVAAKIRATAFTGWTTGGTGSTVTFTATAVGTKTDATYSAGTTGASGTMTTTTQGVAAATTTIVATAIRSASYPGWTTGGTGAVVTFTATSVGTRTAPIFSGGTTGTTGTFVRTAIGEAANFHRYFWNGSAWTDGGAYQAFELTNGAVLDKHVDNIASRKITDERFIDLSKNYGLSGTSSQNLTVDSVRYVSNARTTGNGGYTKLAVPLTQDQTISATVTVTPPQGATASNTFQFTAFIAKAGVLKHKIAERTCAPGTTQVSISLDYDAIKVIMDTNAYDELRILLWNQQPTVDAGTIVSMTNFKQTDASGNVISQNVQDNMTQASRTLGDNSVSLAAVKTEVENARGGYANIDARMDKLADGTDITKLDVSRVTNLAADKIPLVGSIDLSKSYGGTPNAVSAKMVDYTFPAKDGTTNGGFTATNVKIAQDQIVTADLSITTLPNPTKPNSITLGFYYTKNGSLVTNAGAVQIVSPGSSKMTLTLDYDTIVAAIAANAYDKTLQFIVWNQSAMDAGTRIVLSNLTQTDELGNAILFTVGDKLNGLSSSLSELDDSIDTRVAGKTLEFLTNSSDFTKIETRSWFSTASYTVLNGLYTIWWTEQNPGIKINIPNDLTQSDHADPMYITFRARVIEGSGTDALKFTAVNKNIKTVETTRAFDLTYDWQDFVLPFRFNQTPSDGVWDGVFVLLQVAIGSLSVKIQVDSPVIYAPKKRSVVTTLLNEIAYKENSPETLNSLLKGQIPKFDAAYITPVPVTGHHNVTPVAKVETDGQVLDKISYYVPLGAKTVTFTVGYIDQYNLLVAVNSFNVTSTIGYNEYTPLEPISIPSGARLFMDISQFNVLYDSNDQLQYIKHEAVLIQEELTTYNSGGYSGMTFYESTHMIPFAYTVRAKTLSERMKEAEVALELTSGDIVPTTSSAVVRNPNGIKYSLMVDSTGALKAVSHAPSKVFVMGNSLTLGFGTFGMAASDPDHDWYHYVEQNLLSYNPNLVMSRISASTWEGGVSSAERLNYLNATVAPACAIDTDLIIIQLGDNVNTTEKQETFADDAIALVQWLRNRCPNARILWVNGWYNYNFCFPHIQTACDIRGAEVVDIRSLSTDSANKSAVGNQWTADYITYNTIVSDGVASHPGNTGMLKISQEIISVLDID